MPLRVGDVVPSFESRDADGRAWSDASLRGSPYVLFFYPADETPGCIRQSCAFRDLASEFGALGVQILGVSGDDAESHRHFAQRRRLPYPLLTDEGKRMRRAFGALAFGLLPLRVSYLVGADGRVAGVHDGRFDPAAHADRMLDAARALKARA